MTWCFSFKKQKFATLSMTQQYIYAHQTLKRQFWNYLMTCIWFLIGSVNSMMANPSKFQIMFLGSNIDNSKITFMIGNNRVKSRSKVKQLSITIDDKLLFTRHIENLCSTASMCKFISFEQAKRLSGAYIMSTFTYCS